MLQSYSIADTSIKICNTTRRLHRRIDMSFMLGERLENNAVNEGKIVCDPASQGEIGL